MIRVLLQLAAAAAALLLATAAPAQQSDAEAELTALMDQWAAARVAGDVAFLERFYGEELTLNQMNGAVATRAQDIDAFASGVIKPEYIRDTDLTIKVYGDTAVVTGIESLKGTAGGVPGEMSLRVTNVLTMRDGEWRLVLHHSTLIPDAPPPPL